MTEWNKEKLLEIETALLPLLDAAIAVDNAAKGNVQLLFPESNALKIVAQRGFNHEFLELFKLVRVDKSCACGRALHDKKRVFISDVWVEKSFAPFLSVTFSNGFRAVQSTPLLAPDGTVFGMMSTHFATPHWLSKNARETLDQLATKIATTLHKLAWN